METTDPATAANSLDEPRRRERQLNAIVDCIPGFVWMLDEGGELRFLNSKVSIYTGRSLEELREPRWREVMHPEDIETFVAAWSTAMHSGTPIVAEFRLRHADGEYRWFRTTGTPVRNEQGAVTNWCGVDIDIDDKKRADEALRIAQEQLARAAQIGIAGELLASIADAINQPLTAVVANGYACQRWLSESPPNWGRATRVVNRIVEDGTAAADVVRRIHKIVTRTDITKSPLDINRAIVVVLRLQDLEIRKHAIVVSTSLDADLPVIQADVTLIQQVLANLIRNAINAMSVQSNVQRLLNIKSRHADGLVIVEIADNGIGFADQAPIFEPLYSTKAEGLGLGLTIAKSIVESYAGSLWSLHNQPHGSIFGFSLPA